MGYDMLEGSEMGALSESRLGNKCFIDDDNYSNAISLRGKKYHDKKRTQAEGGNIASSWAIDPTKENDCSYLQDRLIELQNAIEVQLSSNPTPARIQNVVKPMKEFEAQYKNKVAKLKCVEQQATIELQKQKEDTLAEINKASASTPDLASAGSEINKGGSKTTKYLMYGIGGIVVAVTLIIIIKAIRK
jgi:hypothetical protein